MAEEMFKKLSRADLQRQRASALYPEYAAFLSGLKAGEGGTADVKQAGVSRQSVKNRLNKASDSLGLKLKFHRSGQDALIFEVVKKK